MLFDGIRYVEGSDWNYDVAGSTLSTPSAGDIIMRFKATRAFRLPQNLTGSQFHAEVAPGAGGLTLTIYKNAGVGSPGGGSALGTIVFNSGSNTPDSETFGSDVDFAIGDRLEVEATVCDSADDIYVTFKTQAV